MGGSGLLFFCEVNLRRVFSGLIKTNRKDMSEITLKFLSLDKIKEQARVEKDFHDEDDYLMLLGKAAERKLFQDIQRTYDEVVEQEGEWPIDLTLAALLLTSGWYKHREPAENANMYAVPYGYEALYMPYRKGTYSSVKEDSDGV